MKISNFHVKKKKEGVELSLIFSINFLNIFVHESKGPFKGLQRCMWLRCSSLLWPLTLWRVRPHYPGLQGQCYILAPIVYLPQVSPT